MFMTKSRHEREMRELRELLSDRSDAFVKDRAAILLQRGEFEAKFKKAIDKNEALKGRYRKDIIEKAVLRNRAEANEADAKKWRDRAAREAKRGQNRKASGR